MNNFEINYDLRPYLPDIYVKQNILTSFDLINNNNTIGANSVIFIININRPLNSIYNDPLYILSGIENVDYKDMYEFPPLNYFNFPTIYKQTNPFRTELPIFNITNNIKSLLLDIGYDIDNINEDEFQYQELFYTEFQTKQEKNITWIYFNFKKYDTNYINYNNYRTTVYFNNKYCNVLIYPFLDNIDKIYTFNNNDSEIYNLYNPQNNSKKYIETIDFDDREIIKYYEKLDYKYFENLNYTTNEKSDFEILKNYTFYIKNYVRYIEDNNSNVININLNEISKKFYYSLGYEEKYEETYTNTILNNKHINNYKVYSNNNCKYSMTMDNKIGNLSKLEINLKEYSNFDYDITNNPTTYMQTKNYYVNAYWDIVNLKNLNNSVILNFNLMKIFLIINPLIIDDNYLIDNVFTSITPLFKDANNLKFGDDKDKLKLYLLGNIKYVNLYYIDKYKINFEFTQNNKTFSYIIILGITFYNSANVNILNTNGTENIDDLAYVNYTTIEESISISPTINNFKNLLSIYENFLNYDIKNTSKYYYSLNYEYLTQYPSQSNFINFINYFFLIPNVVTNLKTSDNKYYNNVLNVLMIKVNNYIKNFLNVEENYYNYINKNNILKNYICLSVLYDENIIKKKKIFKCCYDCCKCTKSEEDVFCEKNCLKCDNDMPTCINEFSKIKYIEYYSNFPKIDKQYIDLDENFIGKYSQILVYPYTTKNIDSFDVVPAGKYLKFNYINFKAKYPDIINEDFVKSIKSVKEILNYNFSLFVMLPYDINQDDNFYCTNPKLYWTSNYSMGISSNKTCLYLVLTDLEGNPFNFYKEIENYDNPNSNPNFNCNPNSNSNSNPENYCFLNGIIYGIKLYNYTNYYSENLKLNIILNLFMNNYLNLSEFIILTETYEEYSDANNVLWNINESYLKLHNFESLKEMVFFDFKRFKNKCNMDLITKQYKNFNYKNLEILYNNKLQLHNLRYSVKVSIYLSNLYKILNLINKCKNYLIIIKTNIMIDDNNNSNLCSIVKYLIGNISNLFEINYNLSITSGTFDTIIYDKLSQIYLININNNVENISNYIIYCDYLIYYSNSKINNILEIFNSMLVNENNLYYSLYWSIYFYMGYEQINYKIGIELDYDIDNFIKTTSPKIFDNIALININEKSLLLEQVGACLKIIELNSTKINELYNLAQLMSLNTPSQTNPFLPDNLNCKVTKNDYIYNTYCYTKCSNVPVFNVISFMEDMINLIEKLSIEGYSIDYIIYQKAILEGVITFGKNTIKYFKEILDKIVGSYLFINYLSGPIQIIINIFKTEQIGLFYELLEKFNVNYMGFFDIIYQNKINKFYEYDNLKNSFENLFYSCKEFLFYVTLKNDFINNNTISYKKIYVNEDLYKIIKTDVFLDFAVKTIKNINNLVIKKNPKIILFYLKNINEENKLISPIINITQKVLNEMILQLEDKINYSIPLTIDIIDYGSYYILPYQDLLLFKGSFTWASFNFNKYTLEMIKPINQLNSDIFKTFYTDPNTNDFYKQSLNYTYLNTPFKYININNNVIN